MKLFHVRLFYDSVVVADDVVSATDLASELARDIVSDANGPDGIVSYGQITRACMLPAKWDDKCFPYSPNGTDARIGDFLSES